MFLFHHCSFDHGGPSQSKRMCTGGVSDHEAGDDRILVSSGDLHAGLDVDNQHEDYYLPDPGMPCLNRSTDPNPFNQTFENFDEVLERCVDLYSMIL